MAKQASPSKERFEDVFQDEIIRAFVSITSFKKFARSKNGLCLDELDIQTIIDDHENHAHEQKLHMLNKWREITGEEATVSKIRNILRIYLKGEDKGDGMNATGQNFQNTDNEARRLIDIEFAKIKSGTSETFTLFHIKLITFDAEYFCSQLKPDFSLKELKIRHCNVDKKFLLAIKKYIPNGKVEHTNFSGNNQIDLTVLKDIMTQWGCESLDLSNIEFDETKMNDLRHIPLRTLILDYSSFPVASNAVKCVAELLQTLKNLSLVSSTISTDQLKFLADNLSRPNLPWIDGWSVLRNLLAKAVHAVVVGTLDQFFKLQSLDLSHVQLEDKGLEAVCNIINKKKGIIKLSLSNCGLTARKLRVIVTKLKQTVFELNISDNSEICISDVGKLAAKLKIQNLDISKCGLRVDDLKKLPIYLENHRLRWIDVTDPRRVLGEERRKEILSILFTVAEEVRTERA